MRWSRKSSRTRRTSSQIAPRCRRWLECRCLLGRCGQLANDRWIGRRQLEPLADRAVIDSELAANRPSGRDVLVQSVCLGDARRAACQTPPIAFRIGVMLVGGRRRLTKTTKQAGQACRWWQRNGPTDLLDHIVDGSDHATRGVEQAQLVHSRWPDLGERGRIQTRIVGDHLVGLNASSTQPFQKRLDVFLIDGLGVRE